MTKNLLSTQVVEELKKNPYVQNVSTKGITYTLEFRRLFVERYHHGETAEEIFESCGLGKAIIGQKRITSAKHAWTRKYNESGVLGLNDDRKYYSGRPKQVEDNGDIIRKQAAEIEMLKEQLDLVKKLDKSERSVLEQTGKIPKSRMFALIEKIINEHHLINMVSYLCELGNVSKSGYYRYLSNKEVQREKDQKDLEDFQWIKAAYDFKGFSKGSRMIKMVLESVFGICFNRKKIQRLMRKYNLDCKIRRSNPYKQMMKATQEHSVVPNKLQRCFKQEIPYKILLTDITYLNKINGKWFYLSVVKDASTNEILAAHVEDNLRIQLVTETITQLTSEHELLPETLIHSDQGVHYTSPIFQEQLKENSITQSMSRRGNCWDNAPIESFFGHMKDEVDFSTCKNLQEIQELVNEYIEYYNNYRYQWDLKKMTPVQYRNHLLVA